MLKSMGRKYLQVYDELFCLSKPVLLCAGPNLSLVLAIRSAINFNNLQKYIKQEGPRALDCSPVSWHMSR